MLHVAQQDLVDAEWVGRVAVRAAMDDQHLKFVSLRPLGDSATPHTELIPLAQVTQFRTVPPEWVGKSATSPVTEPFLGYAARLIGPLLAYAPPLKDSLRPLRIQEYSK